MKLVVAKERIEKLANIPFKDYLNEEQFHNIILNKGRTGQLLELTIGLNLSNTTLDFEDGELKTNKCDHTGKPLETMFITQPFHESKLYKKFQNILYVPISKDGSPYEWMYLPCLQVDLSNPLYHELARQLEEDYYTICDTLNTQLQVSNSATLHTANGKPCIICSSCTSRYISSFLPTTQILL